MRTMRWGVRGMVAALALALAVGTGGAAQEKVSQVVVAVGGNMNHVPSFVGLEKGIFLKYNIDLKLRLLAAGHEITKDVQAGEAHLIEEG